MCVRLLEGKAIYLMTKYMSKVTTVYYFSCQCKCNIVVSHLDIVCNQCCACVCVTTGPTFAAASCMSGQKEGNVVLYKADQYPHQPLGPVQFLWRPCSTTSPHRQLWIWLHPSLKQVGYVCTR